MARINPWVIHRAIESLVPDVDFRQAARDAGARVAEDLRVAKHNKLVDQRNKLANKAWDLAVEAQEEANRGHALQREATKILSATKAGLSRVAPLIESRKNEALDLYATADMDAGSEGTTRKSKRGGHLAFDSLFHVIRRTLPRGLPQFDGIELVGYDNSYLGWSRASILWMWAMAPSIHRATLHPVMAARMAPVMAALLDMERESGNYRKEIAYMSSAMTHYAIGPASKHREDWNVARCFFEMAKNAQYETDESVIPSGWVQPGLVNEDPLIYLTAMINTTADAEPLFFEKETAINARKALSVAGERAHGKCAMTSVYEVKVDELKQYENGVSVWQIGNIRNSGAIARLPLLYRDQDPLPAEHVPLRRSIVGGMHGEVMMLAGRWPDGSRDANDKSQKTVYEMWLKENDVSEELKADSLLLKQT
ncbi:hypothetical protein [Alcanivorax sp. 1008]|uniref:hypothetical protein n=1 Tax=Alcanivorax sp. 1008 TaxID=2816853 RepID=UPI001DF0BE16|nr:hypothetical protein [Alcanivorax sp. 1008]MCC1496734.1 hypothetical protein [Alcanivorax sp. 1008]